MAWRSWAADDVRAIRAAARAALAHRRVDALIATGGTGMAPRDVTPEALAPLCERPFPGFGELFRMISRADIQSGADLRGKMVASSASTPRLFAIEGVRRLGLVPNDDVSFLETGGTSASFTALLSGQIGAAVVTPPFDSKVRGRSHQPHVSSAANAQVRGVRAACGSASDCEIP